MKWAVKLGRFAGIDVHLHATFFLLLVFFGYSYWVSTGTLAGVATGLSLILLLFLCVVLHEYGHALTARRFGIGTRNITLLPIGGVAMLERMPEEPRQEIVVALAGPAVNVAIAALLWLVMALMDRPGALIGIGFGHGSVLPSLLAANVALALFNLLPAFPMDGGRVLRALLAMRTDRLRATRLAAGIGRVLAVGFGILGLMGNPFLLLIAVFVWIGAGAEAGSVRNESRLTRRPAGLAMITEFHTLAPGDPLSRAVDLTLSGSQKDFPVLRGSEIAGVATQAAIMRGLRDAGLGGRVADVTVPVRTADVDTPLDRLLQEMQSEEASLVCITRAGRLAGILNLDNILEFVRIQSALGRN